MTHFSFLRGYLGGLASVSALTSIGGRLAAFPGFERVDFETFS
jgi:hypothetical protein